jgi:hypothetical protein
MSKSYSHNSPAIDSSNCSHNNRSSLDAIDGSCSHNNSSTREIEK